MKFRSSLSARILCVFMTIGVTGSALAVAAGAAPWTLLPYLIMIGIGGGIVALVMGVYDYPVEVTLLSVVLPMALWPYVFLLLWVAEKGPQWAWLMAGIGVIPTLMTLFAGRGGAGESKPAAEEPRSAHG